MSGKSAAHAPLTCSASEASKEPTLDGVKKSQVKRVSMLPVQTGKTGVIRQPLKSQHASDQVLKNQQQVSLPAESSVQLENAEDKENKHGHM